MTAFYSVLHLLVDGVCAIAMFGTFIQGKDGYFLILLYNFCAFALQMPLGIVLDALHSEEGKRNREAVLRDAESKKKKIDPELLTAAAGVFCTIAGAFTHPVILGIGNALFHVGAGVGTIRDSGRVKCLGNGNSYVERGEDARNACAGSMIMRLGMFVAPGAIGLYFGRMLAESDCRSIGLPCAAALLFLLCSAALCVRLRCAEHAGQPGAERRVPSAAAASKDAFIQRPDTGNAVSGAGLLRLSVGCLLVVILRSYIGMSVVFSWKTGISAGILAVLAVAGGKAAGGLLAAWRGPFRTAAVSLFFAAVCYLFSDVMPFGLAALFLFNMTMPITLYRMIGAVPRMPGFAFGFLTFALFLGFLPCYLGVQPGFSGKVVGSAGSLLSLLFLMAGIGRYRRNQRETV